MSARLIPARIVNEVIKALNEEWYLPRFIIIMPDKDLIEEVNFGGFGCKIVFEVILSWMAKEINNALEMRRDDLRYKRAGSVDPDVSTSVVWIEMPTRPFIKTDRGFGFAQRHTFNKTLKTITDKFGSMSSIALDIPEDRSTFDITGNLSAKGKKTFWKQLNRSIRRKANNERITRAEAIIAQHKEQAKCNQQYQQLDKQKSLKNGHNNLASKLSLERAYHTIKRHK